MIRLLCTIAAIALAATPTAAKAPPAEGWTQVHSDADSTIYIRDEDWTKGRPTSTSVLVWSWLDPHRRARFSHEISLLEIDCTTNGYRIIKVDRFDAQGNATSRGGTGWDFATPETVIGHIVFATCLPAGEEDYW